MDFSQIELRVMAHVSEEQTMIDAFIAGEDLHALTASAIYGKSEVDDKERAIGKRINFGVIYGIGREKLSKQADISEKDAQDYLDRYWKVYPNIKKYFDSIIKSARRRGYVETLFGRKVKIDEDRPYAAVNYIVQGTAGDITKVSLLRTYNFLKNSGGTIRNTVHDQILFDNLEEDQIPKLKGIMENFNFVMPTPVDVMRSTKSWGDLVDA
jgi:DNA polymerase-1